MNPAVVGIGVGLVGAIGEVIHGGMKIKYEHEREMADRKYRYQLTMEREKTEQLRITEEGITNRYMIDVTRDTYLKDRIQQRSAYVEIIQCAIQNQNTEVAMHFGNLLQQFEQTSLPLHLMNGYKEGNRITG